MPSATPRFDAALADLLNQATPGPRTCEETGEVFDVSAEELEICKKHALPPPRISFSAAIRHMRSFIAGFDLFKRTTEDGKILVSMYDPESPAKILPPLEWYGARLNDDFLKYGRPYDATRSFFEQWSELSTVVPRPSIFQDPKNENCDWVTYTFASKNCYSTFGGGYLEDVLYSEQGIRSQHSTDLTFCDFTEWSYDLVQSPECSRVFFSEFCERCVNSSFCFACVNCQDCFGCSNLKGKKYCFLNEQLTEEAYHAKVKAIDLQDAQVVEHWRQKIRSEIWSKVPRRGSHNQQCENVVGDDHHECTEVSGISLYQCERTYRSFGAMQSKDCYQISSHIGERNVNSTYLKECFDTRMSFSSENCLDIEYCESLNSCEHCFGCIGLANKKYCIFNTQYDEQTYWNLVDQIKTKMLADGEYGSFFPYNLSQFAYNTCHADTLFPLSETEVKRLGGRWHTFPDNQTDAQPVEDLPINLAQTPDSVLQQIFRCPESGRIFRFVKPELDLHRTLGVALPRLHPTIRRKARIQRLLPIKLWPRTCDTCHAPFESRIDPEQPFKILCDDCFEKMMLS